MKEKQILNVLPGTVRRQVEREELRYDLLQEIRLKLGLVPSDRYTLRRALRLDDCERAPVVSEKNIVSIPDTGCIRHALELVLVDPIPVLDPTGIPQLLVNVHLACPVLRDVIIGQFEELWHVEHFRI